MDNTIQPLFIPIPIFNGENYDFWSNKIKTYFTFQDLWDMIEEGFSTLEDTSSLTTAQKKELKENKQKNSKALFILQQVVTDTIFLRIMGATTAKEAWTTLQEEFEGSEKVRAIKLQTLQRDFELLNMKESETVKDYYSKIKEIVNQMRAYGKNILDKKIVEKILISVSHKYDPIMTMIAQTKDLSTLSVAKLMGSLEAYEQSICKRINHAEKDYRYRGKSQCFHCKKIGHVEKYCRKKNKHQANFAEEKDGEQHLFYASQDSNSETSGSWYLDSGCSNHMAKDACIFKDIDESVKVKVRMGNDTIVESEGKGTVMVETKKGTRLIADVLLVPNLKENLLSIGQMIEKGYTLHFEGDTCKIYDNKRLEIGRVKMEKRTISFPISLRQGPKFAMKAEVDNSWLWHRIFGHFNTHALKLLYQKNMMRDLLCLKENIKACEGCLLGKQHRLPFSTGKAWRAKDLLELIHTDICGPMQMSSLHNNRYFILFIDDFSRMIWVYFIKAKSEVFGIFKKFKTLVEKQSGKQIKVLRSDRGKEYTSREFNKFCEDEGIEKQLTVAYSPQQNGVSERKNCTVMEMARPMLKEKGLPNTFWDEAIYTTVYILNKCPAKVVQDKTPLEA
uniref:Retrovirus-related Pol polyprotein from transposon TNT 1-94 n=1 Tax=Cajanus cajan TaxID=3821 RepID=A0A151RH46_CAJCA|nr:Retrovirus-related Pol polyprotein from transposon TNT 1-94 [Cajanus cajan]KYP41870.1 Retrovirus-related Pol polyprotein from transposon TNT 1-94 [Cajanus cajan]